MSAATPARDTDSSVEEDPAAGRSVDRAPREGRSRARRDRSWTLRASAGAEGHHRKGAKHRQRWRCGLPSRSSPRVIVGGEAGSRTRSARADRGRDPGRPSAHREVRSGRESQRRATGDSTKSRRTPRTEEGQPASRADGRRTGEEAHRRKADGSTTPGSWRDRRKWRNRQRWTDPLDLHLVLGRGRREARARPRGRRRRRTARGEQAAAMRHGCRRGASLRRVGAPEGTPDPTREASASTTDPAETWRTRTRYRLQHAGSRERRKPPRWRETTRAERDRRSGIRRPREGSSEPTWSGRSRGHRETGPRQGTKFHERKEPRAAR